MINKFKMNLKIFLFQIILAKVIDDITLQFGMFLLHIYYITDILKSYIY